MKGERTGRFGGSSFMMEVTSECAHTVFSLIGGSSLIHMTMQTV